MSATETRQAIESILMVADNPVDPTVLAQLLEVPKADVEAMCDELAAEYEAAGRGFILARVAGGYRFQSHPDLAPYVERFVLDGQTSRLSSAALETLAIVAYKQPISRMQIAAIRGVNVDGVLRTLQQRGYVDEVSRDTGPGNAVLFGTTDLFLERVGLDSTADLPPLAEFVPGADVVEALEDGLRPDPVEPPAPAAAEAETPETDDGLAEAEAPQDDAPAVEADAPQAETPTVEAPAVESADPEVDAVDHGELHEVALGDEEIESVEVVDAQPEDQAQHEPDETDSSDDLAGATETDGAGEDDVVAPEAAAADGDATDEDIDEEDLPDLEDTGEAQDQPVVEAVDIEEEDLPDLDEVIDLVAEETLGVEVIEVIERPTELEEELAAIDALHAEVAEADNDDTPSWSPAESSAVATVRHDDPPEASTAAPFRSALGDGGAGAEDGQSGADVASSEDLGAGEAPPLTGPDLGDD